MRVPARGRRMTAAETGPDGSVEASVAQVESDVIQDVLLTVHRVRHTYDPARAFTPWLRAIAQRRAIDALRLHGRQRTREIHAPLAYESHPDSAPTAVHTLEQSDGAHGLRAALAAPPDGQRQ